MSRVAAILVVANLAALAAAPGCDRDRSERQSDEQGTKQMQECTPSSHSVTRLTWEQAAGIPRDRMVQAEVEGMATRFARGLVRWLYGDRTKSSVPAVTDALRRELAASTPFIPPDQLGTLEGRAVSVEVALQPVEAAWSPSSWRTAAPPTDCQRASSGGGAAGRSPISTTTRSHGQAHHTTLPARSSRDCRSDRGRCCRYRPRSGADQPR